MFSTRSSRSRSDPTAQRVLRQKPKPCLADFLVHSYRHTRKRLIRNFGSQLLNYQRHSPGLSSVHSSTQQSTIVENLFVHTQQLKILGKPTAPLQIKQKQNSNQRGVAKNQINELLQQQNGKWVGGTMSASADADAENSTHKSSRHLKKRTLCHYLTNGPRSN